MVKEGQTQTIVKIPTEDYREFQRLYPGQGSWTWFVRATLIKFLGLHADDPEELMEEAVKGTKEEMRDG